MTNCQTDNNTLFLNPNEPRFQGKNDSESIQNALDCADGGAVRTVLIPRRCERTGKDVWNIEKTLLLPNDVTVILDDCHLRLADGVFENIFRNKYMGSPFGLTAEGEQHGIHIIGFGNAVLDGGKDNGVREQTFRRLNLPHPRTGNLILLDNVRDYSLENFQCVNMRYWAINQIACRRGTLRNLSFFNGERHSNQDGINFRIGCYEMTVENVSGRTGDDVIALSAFPLGGDAPLLPEGRSPDIHDVLIRNVRANTHESVVALRNTDGAKLYNVTVENAADVGGEYGAWCVVRLGENNYYKRRAAIFGETYGITVRGIRSRARGTVLLAGTLRDSVISDVFAEGTTLHAVSTYGPEVVFAENNCKISGGVTMENVLFENIHYNGTSEYEESEETAYDELTYPGEHFSGCALDFRCLRASDTLKNVRFRNIFAREGAPLYLSEKQPNPDIQ